LLMSNDRFAAFTTCAITPAAFVWNVLPLTVRLAFVELLAFSCRPLEMPPLLLANVDDCTFTDPAAELKSSTRRPCWPFGAELLENVLPVAVITIVPVRFTTCICRAALLWMLALVSVTVPERFWNSRPLSNDSLPAFFTSLFVRLKPFTALP